jgi:hypothetical protein
MGANCSSADSWGIGFEDIAGVEDIGGILDLDFKADFGADDLLQKMMPKEETLEEWELTTLAELSFSLS